LPSFAFAFAFAFAKAKAKAQVQKQRKVRKKDVKPPYASFFCLCKIFF
jgi:hypothetical protein